MPLGVQRDALFLFSTFYILTSTFSIKISLRLRSVISCLHCEAFLPKQSVAISTKNHQAYLYSVNYFVVPPRKDVFCAKRDAYGVKRFL